MIDAPFSKYISSGKTHILKLCCQWSSTINHFSKSWTNWNYSRSSFTRNIYAGWLCPRQETKRPNTIFSKKDSRKKKMCLIMPIIFAFIPLDGSCYRVIDSSILQDFFHLSLNSYYAMKKKKQLRKDKRRMNIVVWSCCSKILLCGIHCLTISICDSVFQFNDGEN